MQLKMFVKLEKVFIGLFFWVHAGGQPLHMRSENAFINAGAYSIHFADAFSFTSNPASLGSIKCFQSGILAERKWMLKELDNYEMAASCAVGNAGIGMAMHFSGDADYNEQAVELAYGKNLGRLEMGIGFAYLSDHAAGYRGTDFASAGIGIRYHVSAKLIAGCMLGLPVYGKAGKTNAERGPEVFRMGVGYEWGPDLFMAFQVEKSSGLPVNVIGSLEYRYLEQFFFTFGINSLAGAPFFRSGWKKNRLCVQMYALFQPVLGLSPGLVLLWESKSKKG
jgi:hypothetical protein